MTGTHHYQLYLTDETFRLVGHQAFDAQSDVQALTVGGAVLRDCYDACDCAEIWRDGARVFRLTSDDGRRPFWVTGSVADLTVRIEQTLIRSDWPVSRSKRLIAMLARRSI